MRLMVAHEGVVPQNDATTCSRPESGAHGEPPIKPLGGISGQGTLGREAERPLHQLAQARRTERGIGQARQGASEPAEQVHGTQQAFAQRQALLCDAGVQQFCFEQRQIDIGRAFRGAGLAGEAVAESGVEFRSVQSIAIRLTTTLQSGPDRVRAATGGHDLLTCREESRAHRRRILAAAAAPVALLQVADKRFVAGREGEDRLERQFETIAAAHPQVGVDPVASIRDDLAGIEQVVRIERRLDLPRQLHQLRSEVRRQIFGARHADAVLSGQRTLELKDQSGDFVAQLSELTDVVGVVQIENGADVQEAGSGMAVE